MKTNKYGKSLKGFKKGDKLVFLREPTDEEWCGAGKISHSLKPGDIVTCNGNEDPKEHSENTYPCILLLTGIHMPSCVFELASQYNSNYPIFN